MVEIKKVRPAKYFWKTTEIDVESYINGKSLGVQTISEGSTITISAPVTWTLTDEYGEG